VADPRWVPFVGLSAVVLVLLLGLARVSQRAIGDETPRLPAGPASDPDPAGGLTDTPDRGTGERPPVPERHALAEGELAYDRAATLPPADDRTAETGTELTTGVLLANVALTQGLFGAVLVAGTYFYAIPGQALGVTGDPFSTGLPALAMGVGFGLALWLANETSAAVADAVGAAYDEGLREALAPDSLRGWVILLAGVLPVVAFVEEFIFRAAVVGVPAAGFDVSPWALALVSSGAFAVGHGAQGRVGVAVTGGLGFVLAAGYILSGSLLVVVVAHYLVNALEFLVHEWLGRDRLL